MKTDNLDVIKSYFDFDLDGKFYMFDIDEDFESETDIILSSNEKLIKRTIYDGFETYEDAFNAHRKIENEIIYKKLSKYVRVF